MTITALYTNYDGMLVHEERDGVERAYVPDTLGSLIAEIDSSGAITYEADYWPYGEVRSESGWLEIPRRSVRSRLIARKPAVGAPGRSNP